MCVSSSHAFLGSLAPDEVILLSVYNLGGLPGAGKTFPLSSNSGGGVCLT